ncbi:MAG: DsbA family oxidoreductase [Neomegalonema sp.]|nr:DsbA family oxidoreductase [Neomegalonema sp.]
MHLTLDIFSDPICPWCYIGKHRLARALAAHPQVSADIVWHPFQLNPDMPREGVDRRAYLEAKFGGPEAAERIYGAIAAAASAEGLPHDLDAISRTPNTLDAHRLIRWAGLEGAQDRVVDALFTAYFVQGQDISEPALLTEIAAQSGMDGAAIAKLLEGEADLEEVRAEDAQARARGINSVPTFILLEQYAIPGAIPPEQWADVFAELAAMQPS